MRLDNLRRRRATLEAVRLDLPKWDLAKESNSEENQTSPIVAIDWSEIYSYVMYELPHEEDNADYFAAHYAGLNYLLFKLRCRPVLLPPYVSEMKSFTEMILTRAIAPTSLMDLDRLSKRYDDLLAQISSLQKQYPGSSDIFLDIIKGDFDSTDRLEDAAWSFLDGVLKEYLPNIYLDFQESTLDALQALRNLLGAKTGGGEKRLAYLSTLKTVTEAMCTRSLGGWLDWNAEMDSQRPRLERQNGADALALAYLQALHQASFWSDAPVFFASRSQSMLQVMENHAGEFEPYRRLATDVNRALHSSWRSWDYFAELGYYSEHLRELEDESEELIRAKIDQDLASRIAKLDQSMIGNANGATGFFSGWETLRGSFDLDGLGDQNHWNRIKKTKPRIGKLVDLLRSVLSAENSNEFIARRGQLAKNILSEIESILGSLPPDLALRQTSDSAFHRQGTQLTRIAMEYLDIPSAFERYVTDKVQGETALSLWTVNIIREITSSGDSHVSAHNAKLLLQSMAPTDSTSYDPGARDWLIGIGFFFRSFYNDSLKFLPSWLEMNGRGLVNGLDLFTRALCADAYAARQDFEQSMRIVLEATEEKYTSLTDRMLWHCLKGQLLLEWMEPAGERHEIYPKPGGLSGPMAVLIPMVACATPFSLLENVATGLRSLIAETALWLAGRFVPQNLAALSEKDRAQKMQWYERQQFDEIESWCLSEALSNPSAHRYHTLGYYNLKMALADRGHRWDDAIAYLNTALRLAEEKGDLETERRIADHLLWAEDARKVAQ